MNQKAKAIRLAYKIRDGSVPGWSTSQEAYFLEAAMELANLTLEPQKTGFCFCFICGTPLRMAYPGGEPEDGPAEMRCPDGHPNLHDKVEEALAAIEPEELRQMATDVEAMAVLEEATPPGVLPTMEHYLAQAAQMLALCTPDTTTLRTHRKLQKKVYGALKVLRKAVRG